MIKKTTIKIFGIPAITIETDGDWLDLLTPNSWRRLQDFIKRRDNSRCRYCGKYIENGHIDHVIPLSKGGTDTADNLVWSCSGCNLSKGDNLPDWEFNQDLPSLRLEVVYKAENDVIINESSFELPAGIDQAKFLEFAKGVIVDGKRLSQTDWAGGGRLFSGPKYRQLLSRLSEAGIVAFIDPEKPTIGRKLTNEGITTLKNYVENFS